jgi:hypothetical protein
MFFLQKNSKTFVASWQQFARKENNDTNTTTFLCIWAAQKSDRIVGTRLLRYIVQQKFKGINLHFDWSVHISKKTKV